MGKLNIDSNEELYFSWWLDELIEKGYVLDYTDAKTYQLTNGLYLEYTKVKKTKTVIKSQTLLEPSEYTPDFEIKWHKNALGIFVNPPIQAILDGNKARHDTIIGKFDKSLFIKSAEFLVEIKPSYDRHNMTRLVQLNIKQMMQQHRIFVNLVKIPDLFIKTFTPKRFLYTDSGKLERKINFKVTTLEEYINNKLNERR